MQLCPHLILCLEEYTCCLQAIDLFSSVVCYKLHTQDMTMTITDRAGNSVTFDANRFAAALVVAQVGGGVPLYPFQVNPGLSPFCQVNVKFTVAWEPCCCLKWACQILDTGIWWGFWGVILQFAACTCAKWYFRMIFNDDAWGWHPQYLIKWESTEVLLLTVEWGNFKDQWNEAFSSTVFVLVLWRSTTSVQSILLSQLILWRGFLIEKIVCCGFGYNCWLCS